MRSSVLREIPFRLERSTLFVPASQWSMIEKAASSAADCVCIDLEDSVGSEEKASARANVVRAFTELDFKSRLRTFRVNSVDSQFAYRDLIEVLEAAGQQVDLVMVPKVSSADDLIFVDTLLGEIELSCGLEHRIGIEAQIETASAFLDIREIASSSARLEALSLGPGDYAASMQMPVSAIGEPDHYDDAYPGHRWHAAMHTIVAAARANGLRCLDGPYSGYKDMKGCESTCRIARAMGFDGKQCIHPDQISVVNNVFTPRPDELAWSEEVIVAYERGRLSKQGAVGLKEKMIDAASLRVARIVLEKHRVSQARTAALHAHNRGTGELS